MSFEANSVENLETFLGNPFFTTAFTIVLFVLGIWIAYVIAKKPTCKSKNPVEVYIDDSKTSKMEMFSCEFDWGTRFFPFRMCKLLDVAVSSRVKVNYIPLEGIETELHEEYYDVTPVGNKISKPVKIKNRKFFNENKIDRVNIIVQTPFEREKYETNIKQEFEDNILKVWNENTEEIRNYKLLLNRPFKIENIEVIQGSIDSIDLDIPYSAIESLLRKQIGKVDSDVSLSFILDLPAKKIDVDQFIEIQLD